MLLEALVVLVLTLGYLYLTRNFSYWKKKGVKYLRGYPVVGSMVSVLTLQKHVAFFFQDIYHKYRDEPYVGFFMGSSPALLVNDPVVLKHIMVSDFTHFTDHGVAIDEEANPVIAKQLFFLNGQRWRDMRHRLSPTFSSGRMKAMFPLVLECADQLETRLNQLVDSGKDINIREFNACFFVDVIGSCVFGIKCGTLDDPNNQFRQLSKQIYAPGFKQGFQRTAIAFVPQLAKLFGFTFLRDVSGFFRGLVNDVMTQRKKSGIVRNDFMQILMELKEKGVLEDDEGNTKNNPGQNYPKLTDDDLLAQAMIFFSAGFETSSSSVSNAVFEIAKYPEVQRKARENIEEVIKKHGGKLTYQAIDEMTYIDAILKETLRIYPPAPTVNRECTKNYKIPDSNVTLEVGDRIYIPIYSLHHDEKYFPDPEKFIPERFLTKSDLPTCAYMPFGEGPRQCVAMRFARMQSKLGLISLIRKYELSPKPGSPDKLEWSKHLFRLAPTVPVFVRGKRVQA